MKSADSAFFFFLMIYSLIGPMTGISQTDTMIDITTENTMADRFSHRAEIEYRQAYILPSDPFFKGANYSGKPIRTAFSGHVKYSFGLPESALGHRVFLDTYQGIGLALYHFENGRELGAPLLAYMFQKSRILRISSAIMLDYEWNFGISTGWHPYDFSENPNNVIIGSKLNAYINAGLSLNWQARKRWLITGGIDFTHFSNGNTDFPNAGLNTAGMKLGMIYNFAGEDEESKDYSFADVKIPEYPGHLSYDLVVFGAWRRKGVDFFGEQVASPYQYPVVGIYFAPMYNFGYRFRAGLSADAIYDGSANVYTEDYIIGTEQPFYKPDWDRQIAMGISARGEYVMPVFTISAGIGTHVLHKGGDFRGTYQSIALKVRTSRKTFIHIGYCIKDFYEPNYLMLGMGLRFRSQTPSLLGR